MKVSLSHKLTNLKKKNVFFYTLIMIIIGMSAFSISAQTDVALNKTATASSEENDNGTIRYARLAVDGNNGTRWSSNYSDPQWIQVDLGDSYNVSRVVLRWEAAAARNYVVEISSDGRNYSPLYSRTNMANGPRVDDVTAAGIGRYVRMTGTLRTTTYGYSLFSFEVYGTPNITYCLTSDVAPANSGSVTRNPQATCYTSGTPVTITAVPNAGYRFVNWSGDLTGSTAQVTIAMSANRSIIANFAPNSYTITPSAGANGSISPSTVQTVTHGGSMTFTMTPNAGYVVSSVLVNGTSVGAVTSYTFNNVTSNQTISVSFVPAPNYTLTTNVLPVNSGTVTRNLPGPSYPSGTNVTVTANAATGYRFVNWSGDLTGTLNPIAVLMTVNRTITANFTLLTYTITPSSGANGSISPATVQTVVHGGNTTFTITPNTGYRVSNVLVNGTSVGAVTTYTFSNVTSNQTISATFTALPSYTLTTSTLPVGAGTFELTPPGGSYPSGTTVSIRAIPNAGYNFVNWTGDATGTTLTTSVVMSANRSVTANYSVTNFTITPSAGQNGTISPSTVQSVPYNGSRTFTITPNTGFRVMNVLVDGTSVGALTSYTFNNVTANHTISATFAITSNLTNSEKIAVSGELYDQNGQRLGDAAPVNVNMTIDLFTTETAGSSVYSEAFTTSTNTGVTVNNGFFTARLGDGNASGNLQSVIRNNKNLWIQITVDNNGTPDILQPRTPLNAAPYSTVAGLAPSLTGTVDPNTSNLQAAVGTVYLDTATGITWIRTSANWVRLN
jgi:hypothetical protein